MQRDSQKEYYSEGTEHRYLRYSERDFHARNLIEHLLRSSGIKKEDKILEVGGGAGRFTIHLLKAGYQVSCADISESQLGRFQDDAKKRGCPERNFKLYCMPIEEMTVETGGQYDAIIGFFILHHLDIDNMTMYMEKFRKLLKPGGKICFVEPNRLNPLFMVQILLHPDIKFRYEKGLFRLSRRLLQSALSGKQYKNIAFKNFGFCPPQIINIFPFVLNLEKALERIPILNRILPFLMISADVS